MAQVEKACQVSGVRWQGSRLPIADCRLPIKNLDFRRMWPLINAFGKVRQGIQGENLKIFTFEAGMCMKTNKTMTKCPKKIGHFCLSFGHFRRTDTNFAEIRGESTVAYYNPHGHESSNGHAGCLVWAVTTEVPKAGIPARNRVTVPPALDFRIPFG